MGHTAPLNRFNNTSGPNLENNYGNKGKFTPEQTKERLKVHAIAISTGFPTYEQIVSGWKERFGIEITIQSEKEWRKSNRVKIEKRKQELIESGDIDVPIISDKVLADNLNVLVTENCRVNDLIRKKVTKLLNSWEPQDEDKQSPEKTEQKVKVFKALMDAYDKTNNAIAKSFEKMSDLAGRAKLVDAKAEFNEENPKLLTAPDEEDFDPSAVEVSDEDRKNLK